MDAKRRRVVDQAGIRVLAVTEIAGPLGVEGRGVEIVDRLGQSSLPFGAVAQSLTMRAVDLDAAQRDATMGVDHQSRAAG